MKFVRIVIEMYAKNRLSTFSYQIKKYQFVLKAIDI